jgi:hypothetical protein
MKVRLAATLLFSAIALPLPAKAQSYALQLPQGSGVEFPFHSIMNTTVPATIEAWILGDQPRSEFQAFSRYANGAEHKELIVASDGRIRWLYAGQPWAHTGPCRETGPGVFPFDGAFHHVAFVRRSDGTWEVFLDGSSVWTGGPGGCCWITCNTINANAPTKMNGGDGWLIRGLRVSNAARYSGAFEPESTWAPDSSTVMLLELEEGQGKQIGDIGPANQIGTINGDYEWVFLGVDCNHNGIADSDDISSGYSTDCDLDGVPDECQADCDGDGVPDVCELAQGADLTQDFEGDGGSEMFLYGPAFTQEDSIGANSYLVLTPSGGDYHGYGVFSEVRDANDVEVNLDYLMSGSADGIYVHFVDASTNGVSPPWNSRVLSVFLDTYQNSWDSNSNNIDVNWDGVEIASFASPSFDLNDGTWRSLSIELEGGLLSVTLDNGEVAFDQLVLPSSFDISQAYVAVHGAGNSQLNLVDNVIASFGGGETDCDGNGVLDSCEMAQGIGDCNLNGIFDACEALDDPSLDCDGNGVLDICQGNPDCNGNGVMDACEILSDSWLDCDGDGSLDACQIADEPSLDCNQNGILDSCDIANGISQDCNGNSIHDECELEENDCNGNLIPDDCDIWEGTSEDCDGNGIPDECDLADGTLTDLNDNGVADQCECPVVPYCPTSPNSVGDGVVLSTEGSACPDLNNLTLVAEGGPTGQPGLLFYGGTTANQPFGMGVRCVGAPIYRLGTVFFGGAGRAVLELDLNQGPMGSGSGEITPGSTWYFQLWYRDPGSGSWGFNLSNGLASTFGA